jgi:hypothetical protein
MSEIPLSHENHKITVRQLLLMLYSIKMANDRKKQKIRLKRELKPINQEFGDSRFAMSIDPLFHMREVRCSNWIYKISSGVPQGK